MVLMTPANVLIEVDVSAQTDRCLCPVIVAGIRVLEVS